MNKNEIDKVTSTCICTINENEVPCHNPMLCTERKTKQNAWINFERGGWSEKYPNMFYMNNDKMEDCFM